MSDSQKWLVLVAVLALGLLLYLLAPVLTPFLIGALLAYLGDPVVDRLEAVRVPRTLAVVIVFLLMVLLGTALVLVLLPMLERQVLRLLQMVPGVIDWFQHAVMPHLRTLPGLQDQTFDAAALKKAIAGHWQQLGGAVGTVIAKVTRSGQVLLGWAVSALLIPVVTFYLLRDWDILVARVRYLLPRRLEPTIVALISECDSVLAQFLRGQLLVMLALGIIYTVGLWIAGLDLALLIGMLAGLVSFVPYLGFIVGVAAAGAAAFAQFQDVLHLLYILAVFAVGQAMEGMVLSPWLVGERIGLHPVAVIFAVLAGGQLFGFFGVLLALPAAAVIVVLLRHFRERYLQSNLYTP